MPLKGLTTKAEGVFKSIGVGGALIGRRVVSGLKGVPVAGEKIGRGVVSAVADAPRGLKEGMGQLLSIFGGGKKKAGSEARDFGQGQGRSGAEATA